MAGHDTATDDGLNLRGVMLVLGSALVWSIGGTLGRYLAHLDPWTTVTWRAGLACAALFAFMVWLWGWRQTLQQIAAIRAPTIAVALCFAIASTSFVIALAHTTVANILIIQSAVPLIAALLCWLFLRQRIPGPTWLAIAAVMLGVGIMVSGSFSGRISPVGDALSLLIALAFASGTVLTRRFKDVPMLPAVWLATLISCVVSATMAPTWQIHGGDFAIVFVFGAISLGGGMALFVTGARLIPATLTALIGVSEPVIGPVLVWLVHGEVPPLRTLLGGAIVLGAVLFNIIWQIAPRKQQA